MSTHNAERDAPEYVIDPGHPVHEARFVGGRCAVCGWNAYEDETPHGYVIPPGKADQ